MAFITNPICYLKGIYITEAEIIDRYVGSQLWLWGSNSYGQLGNDNTITRSSPVQTVSTGTNWVSVVYDGTYSRAAIKTDGTLWTWGDNSYGQLGNDNTITRSSPVQTVSTGTNWDSVSSLEYIGSTIFSAIKTDGTLWIWGRNNSGFLGNNNTINRSSPVQTVSQETDWKQVSGAAAIKTDGTLWLWGCNFYGNLGDNTRIDNSSPVQTVSQGNNWKQISSKYTSAAVKTDGTLWLWGYGSCGQLGNNFAVSHSSPIQTVSQGTDWKQVSVGTEHSVAIKVDGTLWNWGLNSSGQLGNNNTINRSSPVQTVSTGMNWKQISAFNTTQATKTDGTLWLWGINFDGELGSQNRIYYSSPVQTVAQGDYWKLVNGSSATTFTSV